MRDQNGFPNGEGNNIDGLIKVFSIWIFVMESLAVVSNRTKTDDDVQSPSKLKIPKDAKYKNALTRFLRILETEKEGVIVVQDLCCRGSLQTLKIDKSKRRLSEAKSCTTLCGCNAHILRILNHVDTVS